MIESALHFHRTKNLTEQHQTGAFAFWGKSVRKAET